MIDILLIISQYVAAVTGISVQNKPRLSSSAFLLQFANKTTLYTRGVRIPAPGHPGH